MQTISVKQLAEVAGKGDVNVIDVRTSVEYREVHVECARNVPLDSLDPHALVQSCNGRGDQPLYMICRSGARGEKAVQKLRDAGIENVFNVEGGTLAWEQAGLPVRRGKKAISLERQVRIAAGFLVLAGSIAGFFNPLFIGLPAFVGAGLMFAGITDTCGMAMVLAKMPWNQCKTDEAVCCAS